MSDGAKPGGAKPGHVYLVGAGPGDPDLLTVRAHNLLQTATHILPDGLVSAAVLALIPATATVLPVGKRFGSPRTTQAAINQEVVALARDGHSVVRLKSGDPLVFGRAGEEIAALEVAGVPFEVVPGISAAFAAAAALRSPLTDRTGASRLILSPPRTTRPTSSSSTRTRSRSGRARSLRMPPWSSTCPVPAWSRSPSA